MLGPWTHCGIATAILFNKDSDLLHKKQNSSAFVNNLSPHVNKVGHESQNNVGHGLNECRTDLVIAKDGLRPHTDSCTARGTANRREVVCERHFSDRKYAFHQRRHSDVAELQASDTLRALARRSS